MNMTAFNPSKEGKKDGGFFLLQMQHYFFKNVPQLKQEQHTLQRHCTLTGSIQSVNHTSPLTKLTTTQLILSRQEGGFNSFQAARAIRLKSKVFPKDTTAPDFSQNTHGSCCISQIVVQLQKRKSFTDVLVSKCITYSEYTPTHISH